MNVFIPLCKDRRGSSSPPKPENVRGSRVRACAHVAEEERERSGERLAGFLGMRGRQSATHVPRVQATRGVLDGNGNQAPVALTSFGIARNATNNRCWEFLHTRVVVLRSCASCTD